MTRCATESRRMTVSAACAPLGIRAPLDGCELPGGDHVQPAGRVSRPRGETGGGRRVPPRTSRRSGRRRAPGRACGGGKEPEQPLVVQRRRGHSSSYIARASRLWPEVLRAPGAVPFAPRADVAQLVEHFTRNEGVGGSSPPVGSSGSPCSSGLSIVRRFRQAAALGLLLGPERGSSRVHARRFGGARCRPARSSSAECGELPPDVRQDVEVAGQHPAVADGYLEATPEVRPRGPGGRSGTEAADGTRGTSAVLRARGTASARFRTSAPAARRCRRVAGCPRPRSSVSPLPAAY